MADMLTGSIEGSASCSTSTPPPAAATSKKKWLCDVCKICWFEDYQDAVDHELECQRTFDIDLRRRQVQQTETKTKEDEDEAVEVEAEHQKKKRPLLLVTQDTLDHRHQRNLDDDDVDVSSVAAVVLESSSNNNHNKESSPVITPPRPPKEDTKKHRNAQKIIIFNDGSSNSSNNNSSSSVQKSVEEIKKLLLLNKEKLNNNKDDGDDENDKTIATTVQLIIRDLFAQLDALEGITVDVLSKTLIGKVVAKFKKHKSLGPKANELIQKWKSIVPATATKKKKENNKKKMSPSGEKGTTGTSSAAVAPTAVASAKTKKKKQPVKVQPHSFFAPRRATNSSTKKKTLSETEINLVNSFFAPKLKTTMKVPPPQEEEEEEQQKQKRPPQQEKEEEQQKKKRPENPSSSLPFSSSPHAVVAKKRKHPVSSSSSSSTTENARSQRQFKSTDTNDEMIDDDPPPPSSNESSDIVVIGEVSTTTTTTTKGIVAVDSSISATTSRRSSRSRTPFRSATFADATAIIDAEATAKKKKMKKSTETVTTTTSKNEKTKPAKKSSSLSKTKITTSTSTLTNATTPRTKAAVMKAVAPIFQNKTSKQILTEQRQVELAAKRELERRKEKERQAKRAALFANKSKSNNQNEKPLISLLSSTSTTGDYTITAYNNAILAVKKNLPPAAPKFPVPNHVINNDTSNSENHNSITRTIRTQQNNEKETTILFPLNHPFRRVVSESITSTTNNDSINESKDNNSPSPWRLSSPSSLDLIHNNHNNDSHSVLFTPIQRAMFDTFLIPDGGSVSNSTGSNNNSILWNDKYGMEQHGIVGKDAKEVVNKLVECIDQWRIARKDAVDRMADRHRKLQAKHRRDLKKRDKGKKGKGKKTTATATAATFKKKKRKYEYYDDDDWLVGDDYDEDDPRNRVPNLCLLTGPPSSGKTSMVHHVAKHCGSCKVLEINTTQVRSGAALKHAIEEATQSYSTSFDVQRNPKQQQATTDNNFFGTHSNKKSKTTNNNTNNKKVSSSKSKTNAFEDTDSENSSSEDEDSTGNADEKNKAAVTIVLIDEVDILFDSDGDAGFWSALGSLAKSTKCPIVLTANHCPPQLDDDSGSRIASLSCQRFHLNRPTPIECTSKLLQICRNENIAFRPDPSPTSGATTVVPHLDGNTGSCRNEDFGETTIQKKLCQIAKSCNCDLRKMIHELQVFSCSAASSASAKVLSSVFVSHHCDSNEASQTYVSLSQVSSASSNEIRSSCSDNWRPSVHSIEPSSVRMDKYSIITVKGKNFDSFLSVLDSSTNRDDTATITVRIGTKSCKIQIVDDETMLVLCPPYLLEEEEKECTTFCSRLTQRIVPLSIDCPSLGLHGGSLSSTSTSRIIKSVELVDGTHLDGADWLTVQYVFPPEPGQDLDHDEEATHTNDDNEDVEFGLDWFKKKRHDKGETEEEESEGLHKISYSIEEDEGGIALWTNALSILKTARDSSPGHDTITRGNLMKRKKITTSQSDIDMAAQLDRLATDAHNASDAAFLEDFGDGIPYLSGACKGFAFDHTEDCIDYRATNADTLRMHEKSRP